MEPVQFATALAAGDDRAWRIFLDRHGRLIHAVARKYGMNAEERDDVFQSTCLAVFRSIHTLKNPERLATWVYGIAYRLAIDVHRKRVREIPAGSDDGEEHRSTVTAADPSPLDAAESLETSALVLEGLERLDPRCRAFLEALYLSDPPMTYEEVSRKLNMPLGSIGPTRARCLRKLESLLGPVFRKTGRTTNG